MVKPITREMLIPLAENMADRYRGSWLFNRKFLEAMDDLCYQHGLIDAVFYQYLKGKRSREQ